MAVDTSQIRRLKPAYDPRRIATALIITAFVVTFLSCWTIPLRMAFTGAGSWCTFVWTYDEIYYAGRVQPLVAGATAGNPINGIGEARYISQFFMEDSVRTICTLLHVHVITLFWLWRIFFPIVMAVLLYYLARACLTRVQRPWGRQLCWAAGAAGLALLYCEPLLFQNGPAPEGWIQRAPTNLEYPLSVLLALAYVRALQVPSPRRIALCALALGALFYMRPYAALPWLVALTVTLLIMLRRRLIELRAVLALAGMLALIFGPWLAVMIWDRSLPCFAEMMPRVFPFSPYKIHRLWRFYVIVAGVFGIAAERLTGPRRTFAASAAASMAIMPFVLGLPNENIQLLVFDRISIFYLPAGLVLLLFAVGEKGLTWRGFKGMRRARSVACVLASAGILAATVMLLHHIDYEFNAPYSDYVKIISDMPNMEAYEWVRDHTEADALFLCDDGRDMSVSAFSRDPGVIHYGTPVGYPGLFPFIARRRICFRGYLCVSAISNEQLYDLALLHWATFGYPLKTAGYYKLLAEYKPNYIIWKKTSRQFQEPRDDLKKLSHVVYSGPRCEVWKLDLSRIQESP